MANIISDETDQAPVEAAAPAEGEREYTESELALAKKIAGRIKRDKQHHAPAFKRMRKDMFIARNGYDPDVYDGKALYVANITGRHIKQKSDALYAKNPKAIAKRREMMDFTVWDEDPASLQMAFQSIAMAQQVMQQAPPMAEPMTGAVGPDLSSIPPEIQAAMEQANAVIADYQQGMARRADLTKLARTLELLYANAWREQKPVDFKTGMKKLVRRTCTTAVGYVELGFQREYGPRPGMNEKLADARARLDHMRSLAEGIEGGDFFDGDAEISELELSIAALESEPEIVIREGLIFDFPPSTRIIPDLLTKSLIGFVGARHLTIEYLYTTEQVKEVFGVDLGHGYKGYSLSGSAEDDHNGPSPNEIQDDEDEYTPRSDRNGSGLVCVWKHYDKTSGLVYYLADGYNKWLREPAAPDVFVEDFWPVYALTFNDVESENDLFPPSDVALIRDQQHELNLSRQGKRDHREAASPRWFGSRGALEEEDIAAVHGAKKFSVTLLNKDPSTKLQDLFDAFPIPGVDPNLYDTNEIMQDLQVVVGTQEAQFGGVSKATATESAIAANSSTANASSGSDDLDGFLTSVSRASGQILLKEMSAEKVTEIVGPGAFWPELTLSQIAGEIFLEIEAGSSGKPNQAVEVNNFERIMPLILQIPGIKAQRVAKEAIRRLDDRLDLNEFIEDGAAAIVAQNRAQPMPQDPGADPAAQGDQGADNGPQADPQQAGSGPAFGSNQV